MKKTALAFILSTLTSSAELPESADEFLADKAGITNYIAWCTCEGVHKFPEKFFFFTEGTVETVPTARRESGARQSWKVTMRAIVPEGRESDRHRIIDKFHAMRDVFSRRFNHMKISVVKGDAKKMRFAGKDIDGMRWDISATALSSNAVWDIKCELTNEYRKTGRWVTEEDKADEPRQNY